MKIQETHLKFKEMSVRSKTERIILHHAAITNCSAEDIHRWHLANGWSGAGYHFLVRKNGLVYRLRPEKYVGAHASGANSDSIGICFEGNFEIEQMNEKQKNAGIECINSLKNKYQISKVIGHRDVNATDCPGKNFPLNELAIAKPEGKKTANSKEMNRKKWIINLQTECNRQGFSNQIVDGIFGPITLAGCPTLRYGASGNITKLMQQRLTALSYPCGKIDGIFGVMTRSAVRSFQASKKLEIDGIVGPKTWRALCVA